MFVDTEGFCYYDTEWIGEEYTQTILIYPAYFEMSTILKCGINRQNHYITITGNENILQYF